MAAFYPWCKIIRTPSLFLQNSAFISNVAPVMGSALFCWRQLGRCRFFPNSTLRLGSKYYCLVDPSVMREMLYHSVLPITVATSHTWLLSTWNGIRVTKELNSKLYFILIHLQLYAASSYCVGHHLSRERYGMKESPRNLTGLGQILSSVT